MPMFFLNSIIWAVYSATSLTGAARRPAGSVCFFWHWQADRESGRKSKGCFFGRDEALVSTLWAWAQLWIITPLNGVAAVCVCVCVSVSVCVCVHACLWQNERGGNWNTERAININVILTHQGSLSIFLIINYSHYCPLQSLQQLWQLTARLDCSRSLIKNVLLPVKQ